MAAVRTLFAAVGSPVGERSRAGLSRAGPPLARRSCRAAPPLRGAWPRAGPWWAAHPESDAEGAACGNTSRCAATEQ